MSYRDIYDDTLDANGPVLIAGYEMWPSRILRKCDPIAYEEGLQILEDTLKRTSYYV